MNEQQMGESEILLEVLHRVQNACFAVLKIALKNFLIPVITYKWMRWEREHNINHNLLVESNRIIMASISGYLLSLSCRQYNFLYVFRQVVDCWSKYPQPSEKLSCPKAANNDANESRKAKAANSSILLHLVRELKKLFAQALAFLNRTWSFFIFHWFKHICRLQFQQNNFV